MTSTTPKADSTLEILEAKVHRALDLLTEARKARDEAEKENARLREQLAAREQELRDRARAAEEAERERSEVRSRVERLLKKVDAFEA